MIDLQQNFCDTIKSLPKEFIWSGKRHKIKHSTLIGDYRESGLKDIDIDAKFRSLKSMWIKRLKDSNFRPWKAVASCLLSSVGGDTIFNQNLLLSDTFEQKVNKLPQFYNELVSLWEKFSKCENLRDDQILGQSLWNNKFICAKLTSLYAESLSKKGITKIYDLFSRDGVFKNWDSVSQEFNPRPTHFLEWYSVLNSIPNKWKRRIKNVPLRIKNVTVEQTTLAKTSVGIEIERNQKLSTSYLLVESLNHQQIKSYFLINTIFTIKVHGELYILCQPM